MKTKAFILFFLVSTFSIASFAQQSLYNETFSSKGTWPEGSNSTRILDVRNGKYYFEHLKDDKNWNVTTKRIETNTSRDFEIEMSFQKISGSKSHATGLLYGAKDGDNTFHFVLSNDQFRVSEKKDGTFKAIKSWTTSSSIKTGYYDYNKLKIIKKGSSMYYYINGTLVTTQTFKPFFGKKLGILVYNKQKVAVDYFSVKQRSNTSVTKTVSKTILFEGFNNTNNNWPTPDTSDSYATIRDGDYIIQRKKTSGGYAPTISKYIDTKRDFRITAQIKKVSGVNNNGFGIVFGRKNTDNQNQFFISSDGSYIINKSVNGKRTYIKQWTKSSHIKTGNGSYNYLKVQKKGSKVQFFINSKLVYTSYSTKFYGDRVGFIIYDKIKMSVGYLSMAYEDNKTSTTTTTTSKNTHTIKESILFDGYTSNKNSWSTTTSSDVQFEVKNGNYYIDHKRNSGGWSSTIKKYIDTSRDFKILADFKKINGTQKNGYGIVFGREDSSNQNLFFINGNGSYSINKIKNGKDNFRKNWVSSSAIKKGNGAYNVLKVVKNGTKVEYYINSSKVYTDYSPEFFGDRLGYVIYDKQKVSIAYISVGYLDKAKKTTTNTTVTDNINTYNYSDAGFHFSDQFTNNTNDWFEGDDAIKTFKVKNGKYYLKHKRTEKGWATYDNHPIDTSKDFEIETKLDKISGVNNYGYGLIFGKKGDSDYRFYISSSGYYKIARMINDKEELIKKWTTTSEVNSGNLKSNVLKVKKEGGYYKFYINGNYITRMDYEPFYGDEMGYVVYNNVEVAVDYLRVKYLNVTTPIVTSKKLQLPFNDQFSSNKNNWSTESLDNYSVGINNGTLNIHRKKEGGIFISKEIEINTTKDFIIETSIAREKSGASGMYGLTFGRKNSSNEFTLLISTNGTYMFRKFDNNAYKKIIPFTSSDAIKTGIGEANKLKIVKSGTLLRFYINDQYMNEAPFEPFFGNKIGFTAYHEQKISVKYLNVKYQTSSYNDPPILVITEPNVDLKRGFKIVKTKKIQVKGKATDKDGIYEVLINGVDATVFEDGTFVANVPLKFGTNTLIVKATDIKQSSSTKTFTIKRKSPLVDDIKKDVVVKKEDKLDLSFGKYYALIIGVSEYNESSNVQSLEGLPTKDAKDLSTVLIENYNFLKEDVVLLNDSPTENEILREFVKLKQKVTNKDNVLIFYAGHGIYDESTETGSWLPSDADPEYGLNMISNSTIKDYIKGINSKHTLLISDACFSGSIFKTRTYKTAPKSITRKFELPSRKAITSGTLKTVPNKSVFLKYLIDRLTNNKDMYLTARKIFDKIEEPVMNNSKNVPQYGTIQEVGDEGGDFIFIKN